MIHNLKIQFFHYQAKANRMGAPIYCRLILGSERKQFSTGIFLIPDQWDKPSQRAIGKGDFIQSTNHKLQGIVSQSMRIEKQLYNEQGEFTLSELYDRFLGKEERKMLFQVYEQRLKRIEGLIGTGYKLSTYRKTRAVYHSVKAFLNEHYKLRDIPLKQIDYPLIKAYKEYLLKKGLKAPTLNKIIQRFKQIITYSYRSGYITKDPFLDYKPLREKREIVFLTMEEVNRLEAYRFAHERLEKVKDLYLFSVYSGLGYHEMSTLQASHLIRGFDGKIWIRMERLKTKQEFSVPLLPKAQAILDKYAPLREEQGGYLLPPLSNQKLNAYLKEMMVLLGIDKRITHHTARKTFATTILLYHDVPIEVVSTLLGHSSINITQRSYAQVVNKNVSRHIGELEEKLAK